MAEKKYNKGIGNMIQSVLDGLKSVVMPQAKADSPLISPIPSSATGKMYEQPLNIPPQTPIPETPQYLSPFITSASQKYNVPPDILSAVLKQESSFNPDVISGKKKSSAGATGIAQFMPITVQELKRLKYGDFDPNDPQQAIDAAAFYLNYLRGQTGSDNWMDAIKAYNAGIGNYKKYKGDIPFKETKDYERKIAKILGGD